MAYAQGQYVGTIKYFYFRDHLGSIREMMRANGTLVARFDYDPWERSTTVVSTTLPEFNFTGLYRHSVSNLDFAVYRAYDPDLGRWLNRDPIAEKGGTNLYAYVSNTPLALTDMLGLYAMMRCYRCKDDPLGSMACFIEENGTPGPVIPTNLGPNNPSVTPGNPYGSDGPLPPGNYDILPKPTGPATDTQVSDGVEFHKGMPSVTTPGLPPGSVRTPTGVRGGVRIHFPGRSKGCITCENYQDIEAIMNRHRDSGGMHLQIMEVNCCR
jgi:RHS repeat-associated protein